MRPLVVTTLFAYLELADVIVATAPFYTEYQFRTLASGGGDHRPVPGGAGRLYSRSVRPSGQSGNLGRISILAKARLEGLGTTRDRIVKALNYLEEQGDLTLKVAGLRQGYRVKNRPPDVEALKQTLAERFETRERNDLRRVEQVVALAGRSRLHRAPVVSALRRGAESGLRPLLRVSRRAATAGGRRCVSFSRVRCFRRKRLAAGASEGRSVRPGRWRVSCAAFLPRNSPPRNSPNIRCLVRRPGCVSATWHTRRSPGRPSPSAHDWQPPQSHQTALPRVRGFRFKLGADYPRFSRKRTNIFPPSAFLSLARHGLPMMSSRPRPNHVASHRLVPAEIGVENHVLLPLLSAAVDVLPDVPAWRSVAGHGLHLATENVQVPVAVEVSHLQGVISPPAARVAVGHFVADPGQAVAYPRFPSTKPCHPESRRR